MPCSGSGSDFFSRTVGGTEGLKQGNGMVIFVF